MNSTNRNTALSARARRYLADAGHAFEHAPVEVSLSVLLAIAFSWMVSSDAELFREWVELAVIVVLTGAGAFCATLLHALGAWSTRMRWIVTAAVFVGAALYGVLVLDLELVSEAWRAAALVTAAVLVVVAAPAYARSADATHTFRRVTGRLLLRSLAVLLYAAALFAGLALALGAVNTLFELQLDSRVYAHVFGWIFIVLVTWVVVGGVPDYVRPADDAGAVAGAVHRLSAYLVTPLLAIYYVILYAYSVRIAVTGELPKNLVSPLVIAAGLIAASALILFDREDTGRAPFRSLRAAAPLFVPLCALGIWALTMRLDQYGWTEFRGLRTVLLVALGALAAAASVRIVRRRSLPLHIVPLALAAALVLSVIGPWSVIAGSRRSQQARLATAMADAGLDWNAMAARDSVIPNEPFGRIQEAARYLASHFGPAALPPLFAPHVAENGRFVDVAWEAGLRPARPDLSARRGGYAQQETGALLTDDASGSLHYVRIERHMEPGDTAAADSTTQYLNFPVAVAGLRLTADLEQAARAILARPDQGTLTPDLARVPLHDDTGRTRGELIILEIGFGRGAHTTQVHRLVGVAHLTPE